MTIIKMTFRIAVRDQEVAMLAPAVGVVELEDTGMARFVDVQMEDAGYLSDTIDSADCSLSPMSEPDIMPTLSPICKPEYDSQGPIHELDLMPSLNPVNKSDLTLMEPFDDFQAANLNEADNYDSEMTPLDMSENKDGYHLTLDPNQSSGQNDTDKNIKIKDSEAVNAPKLEDIFDQTGSSENTDSADLIIPVYDSGHAESKLIAYDFKEMNDIHHKNISTKLLNSKGRKTAHVTTDTNNDKTGSVVKKMLDAGSDDLNDRELHASNADMEDLPNSCKMFDTCGCGRKSCRSIDKCSSHHSIVADKHKNLVTYKKVVSATPSVGTKAGNNREKKMQKRGHTGNRTRLKQKGNKDKYLVVGNTGLKVSDFLNKQGDLKKKDLEDSLVYIDNCDTLNEGFGNAHTAHKPGSLSGNINSRQNENTDLQKYKNVTVDVVDIHKTGKRCNKLETSDTRKDLDSVNLSLDKGDVQERIKKVLGGRDVTIRLKDVIKDKNAFHKEKEKDIDSSQVKQKDNTIYVSACSCTGKGNSDLTDVTNATCSYPIVNNLRTKWQGKSICPKCGKIKLSRINIKPIKLHFSRHRNLHYKRKKKTPQTQKGFVHVMGRLRDFGDSKDTPEDVPDSQSPSESVLSGELDTQTSQGHYMHTLGLLETAHLPIVTTKGENHIQQTTSKSTRVRKKTPKALALEQKKMTERYRLYVKGLLREQKRQTEQFKNQTGNMRTDGGPIVKEKRKLDDSYELEESVSAKHQRLYVKKLMERRLNVKRYALAQRLKPQKENIQALPSQQPFPILLIKATGNHSTNKRNPVWPNTLHETVQGTATDTINLNNVPLGENIFPCTDTVSGQPVQNASSTETVHGTETNVDELNREVGKLGEIMLDANDKGELCPNISGEPRSLAPAFFSGIEGIGPFVVVRNTEDDMEPPPDDNASFTDIRSNYDDVLSGADSANCLPPYVVDYEGNEALAYGSGDVPYTILRNDEDNELSTVEYFNMENVEIKKEPLSAAEIYEEIIERTPMLSADHIFIEPEALWNTLHAVNEQSQTIPVPMITSTVPLPNMYAEYGCFVNQDSHVSNTEIPFPHPTDASDTVSCDVDSTGRQFTIVSGPGQVGSKVVEMNKTPEDDQFIISSDSEEDVDVVTVDESFNLTAINATATGKTPGEVDRPIGKHDKSENCVIIINNRCVPKYPEHDHSYCIKLGKYQMTPVKRPHTCKLISRQLLTQPKKKAKWFTKSTKLSNKNVIKENAAEKILKYIKVPKQSKTQTKVFSDTTLSQMVMLLPTLNVPVVLSKTDNQTGFEDPGSEKQTDSYEEESDSREPYKMQQHNKLERKRRVAQRKQFHHLRDMIPEFEGNDRIPKVAILEKARKTISDLEKTLSNNERVLSLLELEKSSLSTSLDILKSSYYKDCNY